MHGTSSTPTTTCASRSSRAPGRRSARAWTSPRSACLPNREPGNEWTARIRENTAIVGRGWLKTDLPTKPIILAVEGFARAGGTEILQGTDLRVAGDTALFAVTEVQRGLFPMSGSAVRLRRQIGYAVAAEMLLC